MERGHDVVLLRLGERVRLLRRQVGLSQEELAHRSGMDRTYISQIERGVCNPSVMALLNVAKALDHPLGDLFTEN
jgi:transcriptional regulator with XRE-family HTH domain